MGNFGLLSNCLTLFYPPIWGGEKKRKKGKKERKGERREIRDMRNRIDGHPISCGGSH